MRYTQEAPTPIWSKLLRWLIPLLIIGGLLFWLVKSVILPKVSASSASQSTPAAQLPTPTLTVVTVPASSAPAIVDTPTPAPLPSAAPTLITTNQTPQTGPVSDGVVSTTIGLAAVAGIEQHLNRKRLHRQYQRNDIVSL